MVFEELGDEFAHLVKSHDASLALENLILNQGITKTEPLISMVVHQGMGITAHRLDKGTSE